MLKFGEMISCFKKRGETSAEEEAWNMGKSSEYCTTERPKKGKVMMSK